MNISLTRNAIIAQAEHVGAMQFRFKTVGRHAVEKSLDLECAIYNMATECGAEATRIDRQTAHEGYISIVVMEITDPLASVIESCKRSDNA